MCKPLSDLADLQCGQCTKSLLRASSYACLGCRSEWTQCAVWYASVTVLAHALIPASIKVRCPHIAYEMPLTAFCMVCRAVLQVPPPDDPGVHVCGWTPLASLHDQRRRVELWSACGEQIARILNAQRLRQDKALFCKLHWCIMRNDLWPLQASGALGLGFHSTQLGLFGTVATFKYQQGGGYRNPCCQTLNEFH